jgi:hypothetical protein
MVAKACDERLVHLQASGELETGVSGTWSRRPAAKGIQVVFLLSVGSPCRCFGRRSKAGGRGHLLMGVVLGVQISAWESATQKILR